LSRAFAFILGEIFGTQFTSEAVYCCDMSGCTLALITMKAESRKPTPRLFTKMSEARYLDSRGAIANVMDI